MKKSALIFPALFALAMLADGCSKRQPVANNTTEAPKVATEEIHRTFQMRPNSSVGVDFFNGPIDVQTTDSDTAEVHIIRTTQYESDLKDEPIDRLEYEEYKGNTEEMKGHSFLDIRGRRIWRFEPSKVWRLFKSKPEIRSQVTLKIPRKISFLVVSDINGDVNIGEVEGGVTVGDVNGKVAVARAERVLQLISINGKVDAAIAKVQNKEDDFLNLLYINGNIDLKFLDGISATITGKKINGQIANSLPNVSVKNDKNGNYNAVIGNGGVEIKFDKINGNTSLTSANNLAIASASQREK